MSFKIAHKVSSSKYLVNWLHGMFISPLDMLLYHNDLGNKKREVGRALQLAPSKHQ